MDFATLHKQRKFIMIAALIGAIGTFLNWFTYPSIAIFNTSTGGGGIKGTSFGAGTFTLIGLLACGVLAYLGNQKEHLAKNTWLVVLGASALATILCAIKLIQSSDYGGSIGIGLIISMVGAVATVAAAFIYKNPTDDLKQSLNDIKKQVSK